MIWFLAAAITAIVLIAVFLPLFTNPRVPSAKKALDKRKLALADQLAQLKRDRDQGALTDEEFEAQKVAIETDAQALLQEEKELAPEAGVEEGSRERRMLRVMVGALLLVLALNITGAVYLWKGGWQTLTGDAPATQQARRGGPPMGGNGAPDPMAMVRQLEEKLAQNPADPEGQAMLGRSYIVLERFAEAAEAYGKAVELNPAEPMYRVGYGVASLRSGNVDGARDAFDKVLEMNPDNMDALWFKGMIQIHDRNLEGAKQTWAHLLEVTPAEARPEMQRQIEEVLTIMSNPEMLPDAQ